ncbi:MAG: hypothetical protein HUJ96_09540 [Marinilabiliaceae bacterium]|nr:hypothetical protein [Marinilabiliaceae bacterium]
MIIKNILLYIALIAYLGGVIFQIALFPQSWILCLAGGFMVACLRIYERAKESKNPSAKATRIPAIQLFSTGIMILSSYLMFTHKGYWLLAVLIVAVLELYASFRS